MESKVETKNGNRRNIKNERNGEGGELLSVENLSVSFQTSGGMKRVVDGISFTLKPGEVLGIVGESGSGKSMTALSLMGLLKKEARQSADELIFDGEDLLTISPEKYRRLRGSLMAMIFQEPMTSLNPVYTVGAQVEEMLKLHSDCQRAERKEKTLNSFSEAGLKDAEEVYRKYPHQLSGGQRQRVMIAMAMICEPKLLIADEPTTALDVTIQAKILELIQKLNRDHGTAVILISHDLGVVRTVCGRALVMSQGKIVESGRIEELFGNPQEEYTKILLDAVPGVHKRKVGSAGAAGRTERLLTVEDLRVSYESGQDKLFGKRKKNEAVKGISFELYKGEILGLVGESGCGKSTVAKTVSGLIQGYEGTVEPGTLRPQMVFQDPYGSLNPSKRIGWILEEPLKMRGMKRAVDRVSKAKRMLREVGMDEEYAERFPKDLSGGQRQRVAIAAALITEPELLILDEPVSALDVTVQAQILELLLRLREQYKLTYLFISHDMNVIYQICDRVCVMYEGKIVEMADVMEVFLRPKEEYTKTLLASRYG